MKKFIIGLGVLAIFIAYSFWVRHEDPTIARPTSLAASSTRTGSSTNSGSSADTGSNSSGSMMGQNPTMGPGSMTGQYKDGTYTGSVTDAYYGNVQVSAIVSGGKISSVSFLQYPDTHSESVMINRQAMPYLQQEAIQAQNAQVQIVSGATFTSQAFIQSLSAALSQAKA